METVYTVECRVGRLIEARLVSLRSVDEVIAFEQAMAAAFARAGARSVICADWRQANVMPPDVAARLRDLLTHGNAHLERSAVLLAREHATFNLQVERVVREAASPDRRTFRDPSPMLAWLDEILTPAERARARTFLGEP